MKEKIIKAITCIKAWLCNLATDKVLHFLVCMVIVMLLYNLTESIWTSSFVTIVMGVIKELLVDKFVRKGETDIDDLWANILGVCAGIILLGLIALCNTIHNLL